MNSVLTGLLYRPVYFCAYELPIVYMDGFLHVGGNKCSSLYNNI